MDLEKYRRLFVDESADHLAEMANALAGLERADRDSCADELIDTLFRMAHSMKGMAASLDYEAVSSLAHSLEDSLEPARSSGSVPGQQIQLMYEIVGALEQMVGEVEAGESTPTPRPDLIARLDDEWIQVPEEAAERPEKKLRRLPRLPRRGRSEFAPPRSIAFWQESAS